MNCIKTKKHMSHRRVIKLLKKCMDQIEANEDYDNIETLEVFQSLGFTNDEIEELGFDYLIEEEDELEFVSNRYLYDDPGFDEYDIKRK